MAPPQACSCGYQAASADDLADHLGAQFISLGDIAPDGRLHAEAAPAPTGQGPALQVLSGRMTAGRIAPVQLAALTSGALPQAADHVESAACQCLCGFGASDIAGLDAHLLAAFTPPGAVGIDGRRHVTLAI